MKKPAPRPTVVGIAHTFDEVLAEGKRRIAEEEAKVASMSPEEREAYEKDQAKRRAEAEEILKKLRGSPGFMEIKY